MNRIFSLLKKEFCRLTCVRYSCIALQTFECTYMELNTDYSEFIIVSFYYEERLNDPFCSPAVLSIDNQDTYIKSERAH